MVTHTEYVFIYVIFVYNWCWWYSHIIIITNIHTWKTIEFSGNLKRKKIENLENVFVPWDGGQWAYLPSARWDGRKIWPKPSMAETVLGLLFSTQIHWLYYCYWEFQILQCTYQYLNAWDKSLTPWLNFYKSQCLSGKSAASMVVCSSDHY